MTVELNYVLLGYCLGHINPARTFLGCPSAFHGSQGPKCMAQVLQGSYRLCLARAIAQRVCHFLSFSSRLSSLRVGGESAWTTEGTEAGSFFRTQRWLHEDLFIKLLFGSPGPPTASLPFPGQAGPPWISRCGHGGLLGAPHSQTMATLLLLRPFQA